MENKININSNLRIHWVVFFVVTGILLISKLLIIDISNNYRFYLFVAYLLGMSVYVGVIGFYDGVKMINYLEEYHPNVYQEVYGSKGYAPLFNSFNLRKFINSNEDYGDSNILLFKARGKSHMKLAIGVFLITPIVFIVYMLLGT